MEVKQQSRKFGANSENVISDVLVFWGIFLVCFSVLLAVVIQSCFSNVLLENALVVVYIYMYIENEMNFAPVSRLALYTHCARAHRLP